MSIVPWKWPRVPEEDDCTDVPQELGHCLEILVATSIVAVETNALASDEREGVLDSSRIVLIIKHIGH